MTDLSPLRRAMGLAILAAACLMLGAAAKAPARHAIKDCADCPDMVEIPAGEFTMGSPVGETARGAEDPHKVTIPAAFAVSRFEVTFAEWDACVAAGGCNGYRPDAPWGRGRQPVTNVNWRDAKAYAAWLSRKTGKRYRLLSESEWEYAARAGASTPFAYGATITSRQANFDASARTALNALGAKREKAVPVGSFAPNAFGLYDMHGNLWEWVEDCWNDAYGPDTPADGKPALKGDCDGRVLRGGSWEDYAGDIRAAARGAIGEGERSWSDGIQLAREL